MFTCHGVLWSKLIIVSRQTEKFPLLFFDCQLSMDLLRSQPCKCAADAHDGGRLDVRLDFGPRSGRLSAHLSLNHHHHLSVSLFLSIITTSDNNNNVRGFSYHCSLQRYSLERNSLQRHSLERQSLQRSHFEVIRFKSFRSLQRQATFYSPLSDM